MRRPRLQYIRPSIRFIVGLVPALHVALFAAWAHAVEPVAGLPRFASLRAGEVNVRTGPGVRYPVEWVFVYRHMPIEIVAEFDTWRKVRDWQGTEGWVHLSMLSGRRTAIVTTGRRWRRISTDRSRPRVQSNDSPS